MSISRIWLILGVSICLLLYSCFNGIPYYCSDIPSVLQLSNKSTIIFRKSSARKSFLCNYDTSSVAYPWTKGRSHPAKNLKTYCSKIPNPVSGWQKARRYQENDIAFIICTAASLYKTRAMSIQQTWASRVTNYYFLASKTYPSLPVTVIENTGEDYQSNTKKIFYGLELIHRKQKAIDPSERHKWYVVIGCDTYVNVPHILKLLEPYNFAQPYFIGGSVGEQLCYHKNGTAYKSHFVGGNTAHVFSAALVEALYPHLSVYVETVWPQPNHSAAGLSDVALSCLTFSLGYNMTILPGFWGRSPNGIIEEFGLKEALKVQEPSSWHYIHPAQMLDLDEFYSYQYVDRLTNDENWSELVDFFHLFLGTHYEMLRKRYPKDTAKLVQRTK
ncbi:unnamed protein product [Rotaria magnacalcarata]|uniref:N-acetylgalactosaminide beta-1,3-galactosyltransferase n=1 Tax=Rotaria magnacalcarata TaxID=392030 RepID=A0A816VLI7_9BILA|nr:unnamed protein product [Rotaria magnacalcarata]CAF1650150.1 unnamed protein product [Rotaria magnacalcarata]CAF2122337.1 unnamed protein product [Rotaria magnacalcarata]CAF3933293.1 unnamed protein product [Rotaria magnacalcarata]CAF3967071.1 unnamed protein product [Rotaria magnacalcarata]